MDTPSRCDETMEGRTSGVLAAAEAAAAEKSAKDEERSAHEGMADGRTTERSLDGSVFVQSPFVLSSK
jgi:hypothetical protein